MLSSRWLRWFVIFLLLYLVDAGLVVTLQLIDSVTLAGYLRALEGLVFVACVAWLLKGAYQLWADRRTRWVTVIFSTLMVAQIAFRLFVSDHNALALSLVGFWSMGMAFLIGVKLLRIILFRGSPVLGIARITLEEAIRLKAGIFFLLIMMVLLPILPNLMSVDEKLEYRMQFFLSWSLLITIWLLGFVTIFLACGTITQDIKKKQIFMTMVKPVSRLQYLAGRWVGLSLLNLLLLVIAGTGIYLFALVVEHGPAAGKTAAARQMDRMFMKNEVLVARVAINPVPRDSNFLKEAYDQRLKYLREFDPERWGDGSKPLTSSQQLQIQSAIMRDWHTLPPNRSREFVFRGLENASDYGEYVVLRYKAMMPGRRPDDGKARFLCQINERPWPLQEVVLPNGQPMLRPVQQEANVAQFATMKIPVWLIDKEKGELRIVLGNVDPRGPQFTFPSSITFAPGSDLELLYRVGHFTPNYVRTFLVIWVKLSFITMMALMCGTFLGMPVASLFALLIFFVAMMSGFIGEALENYQQLEITDKPFFDQVIITIKTFFDRDNWFSSFRVVIRALGHIFRGIMPSFQNYQPIPEIAAGRLVPWSMVVSALFRVGILWTGAVTLFGWLIFRKRELARVTV